MSMPDRIKLNGDLRDGRFEFLRDLECELR